MCFLCVLCAYVVKKNKVRQYPKKNYNSNIVVSVLNLCNNVNLGMGIVNLEMGIVNLGMAYALMSCLQAGNNSLMLMN